MISQTTQYLDSWPSDLLQNEIKMKLLEVEEGHVLQCPMAGDATAAVSSLVCLSSVCLSICLCNVGGGRLNAKG